MDTNKINEQETSGWTALHHAVLNRDIEAVSGLLEYGADYNIMDKEGETPLMLAKRLLSEALQEVFTEDIMANPHTRSVAMSGLMTYRKIIKLFFEHQRLQGLE